MNYLALLVSAFSMATAMAQVQPDGVWRMVQNDPGVKTPVAEPISLTIISDTASEYGGQRRVVQLGKASSPGDVFYSEHFSVASSESGPGYYKIKLANGKYELDLNFNEETGITEATGSLFLGKHLGTWIVQDLKLTGLDSGPLARQGILRITQRDVAVKTPNNGPMTLSLFNTSADMNGQRRLVQLSDARSLGNPFLSKNFRVVSQDDKQTVLIKTSPILGRLKGKLIITKIGQGQYRVDSVFKGAGPTWNWKGLQMRTLDSCAAPLASTTKKNRSTAF